MFGHRYLSKLCMLQHVQEPLTACPTSGVHMGTITLLFRWMRIRNSPGPLGLQSYNVCPDHKRCAGLYLFGSIQTSAHLSSGNCWHRLFPMAVDLVEESRLLVHALNNRDLSSTLEGRHISIRAKVVGNLVRLLSGSNDLAQAYFIDYLIRNRICKQGDVDRLTTVVMEQWWYEPAVAWAGCRALVLLDDKFKVDADKFLVGSWPNGL
jgi:hypothetical protein